MVLPLTLLRAGLNQPMLVELKNGETYSGFLVSSDGFMNLYMRDIICTSRDGEKFWKINECYIRGNNIKYLRLPDEVIELAKEEPKNELPRDKLQSRGRARGRGTIPSVGRGRTTDHTGKRKEPFRGR